MAKKRRSLADNKIPFIWIRYGSRALDRMVTRILKGGNDLPWRSLAKADIISFTVEDRRKLGIKDKELSGILSEGPKREWFFAGLHAAAAEMILVHNESMVLEGEDDPFLGHSGVLFLRRIITLGDETRSRVLLRKVGREQDATSIKKCAGLFIISSAPGDAPP